MKKKKYKWYKISGPEAEIKLSENGIGVIEIKGKKICITKFQGEWFGFAYKCPHAGALLDGGYIDTSGNVVCPFHNYKFNIKNGRIVGFESYYLKTYPAELRTEGLFVGIEEEGLFGWL